MILLKFPVCEGRGNMPKEFYTRVEADKGKLQTCGTCRGDGTVLLEGPPVITPPSTPYDYGYPWRPWTPWNPWDPFNRPMITD